MPPVPSPTSVAAAGGSGGATGGGDGGNNNPGGTNTTAPTFSPDAANNRILLTLQSLEDLRDSLSIRVEHLSLAVERLRGQASELERAVANGSPLTPGFGRPTAVVAAGQPPAVASTTAPGTGPSATGLPRFEPLPLSLPAALPTRRRYISAGTDAVPSTDSTLTRMTRRRLESQTRRGRTTNATASSSTSMVLLPLFAPLDEPEQSHHPRGLAPTNLDAVASQPKPLVVRSPAASVEPEAATAAAAEEETTPVVRTVPVPPEVVASEESEEVDDERPTAAAASASSVPAPAPPEPTSTSPVFSTNSIFVQTFTRSDEEAAPAGPSLEPDEPPSRPAVRPQSWAHAIAGGMTTRGLMVQERPGVPAINSRVPPPPSDDPPPEPSPRDVLDRDIRVLQHSIDETQREWHNAWDLERSRALTGGRVPNEYTAVRTDAMRRHVENSHRLWALLARRAQLYGPTDTFEAITEPRMPNSATRGTLSAPQSFLRTPSFRTRAARRPNAPSMLEPQPAPAMADGASIQDMERLWIDRIIRERAGVVVQTTPDQFEYEYYRDFIYDDRRRRHAVPSTGVGNNTEDSWPSRRLELLGDLLRNRSRVSVLAAQAPPPPGGDEVWNAPRRQLLEFIEQSRGRVHEMARELTPDVLADERPGLGRVLHGMERMLASPNMTPDVRVRLERLAQRERDLLREVDAAARGNGGPTFAPPTTEERLERLERARARVRELNLWHDHFRAGIERTNRHLPASRRASDADTVVPATFVASDNAPATTTETTTVAPGPGPAPRTPPYWVLPLPERDVAVQTTAAATAEPEPTTTPEPTVPTVITTVAERRESEADLTQPLMVESSPASSSSSSGSSAASSSDSHRATTSHTVVADDSNSTATKESGELGADNWPVPRPPSAASRCPPHPYVSLLDL